MKFRHLIVIMLTFSLGFLSRPAFASEGHVGEIRYSILDEAQFKEKYGPEWELMKGQAVPDDSELLQLWSKPQVPDARGVFLRCANADRLDNKGNPEGSLVVGAYQEDQFKGHDHFGNTGEDFPDHSHGHSWPGMYGDGGFSKGDKAGAIWHGAQTRGASTRHQHTIRSEGGEETRPRCVTVNAYIKLREPAPKTSGSANLATPPSPTITPAKIKEIMNEITTHPEFRAAVETAVREMTRRDR